MAVSGREAPQPHVQPEKFTENELFTASFLVKTFVDPRGDPAFAEAAAADGEFLGAVQLRDENLRTLAREGMEILTSNHGLSDDPPGEILEFSPLCVAAFAGSCRLVELFLRVGANVDQRVVGKTPLLAALTSACMPKMIALPGADHFRVAQLLVAAGADPTAESGPGAVLVDAGLLAKYETPLDVARSRGDLVEFAELFEANPHVRRAERRRTCAYCGGVGSVAQPRFQVCGGCQRHKYCANAASTCVSSCFWTPIHRRFARLPEGALARRAPRRVRGHLPLRGLLDDRRGRRRRSHCHVRCVQVRSPHCCTIRRRVRVGVRQMESSFAPR